MGESPPPPRPSSVTSFCSWALVSLGSCLLSLPAFVFVVIEVAGVVAFVFVAGVHVRGRYSGCWRCRVCVHRGRWCYRVRVRHSCWSFLSWPLVLSHSCLLSMCWVGMVNGAG